MQGAGELIIGEGEVYVGAFVNGFPEGNGIRKWDNGDYYEGKYFNGF